MADAKQRAAWRETKARQRANYQKTVFQLAHAQLEGGVRYDAWHGAVCQHCGREFPLAPGLDPCAFCNDCKDIVLDKLATGLIRFERMAPRTERSKRVRHR